MQLQQQQQQQQQQHKQSSGATSGLASSLVFTPVQGLELVDPEAQKKKLKELNDKWFASNQQFINVVKK
jgi:U4/U6 small nuclear ribonucleoprotein PRP31